MNFYDLIVFRILLLFFQFFGDHCRHRAAFFVPSDRDEVQVLQLREDSDDETAVIALVGNWIALESDAS